VVEQPQVPQVVEQPQVPQVVEQPQVPQVVEQPQVPQVVEQPQDSVRRTNNTDLVSELRAKLEAVRQMEEDGRSLQSYLKNQQLAADTGKLSTAEHRRLMNFCDDLDQMTTFEAKIRRYKAELRFDQSCGHIFDTKPIYDVPDVAAIEKEKELSKKAAIAALRGSKS
jgi:vacuolar-type H+-ATPase subunit I/STV1